ncbi:hypothetical protein [Flagellimonas pacifica]|uniref:DUF3945 domain-containing protein n=1 Tax=Flagellimonas pacifica TaxID=1247520 RepID=A0A285MW65_9FLAO|nr:hypothetical protein [Allomuricauda parva]SNZ01432.1 hypothetical protein SAMN06265377_3271 [Allomuricauda parva]
MENQVEKVFVKVNQVWHKGEAVSKDENTFKVRIPDYMDFEIEKNSKFLERQNSPDQRFAFGEAKQRLEGAYISFDKLPENIQNAIVKGEEYLHSSTYVNDGALKESVKMVQLMYNQNSGSKLDVQIKRNEPVKLEDAKAYNHQFTKEEFEQMVDGGKTVAFTGHITDGNKFTKLAYYEPKLNDIRTKSALTENTYFFGQKLTKVQAESINKGQETQISINTKKGPKTYMVSYSPRAERFVTKSVENSKANNMKVEEAVTVGEGKKKSKDKSMSL